jgi:hypothetical protein
MRPPVPLCDVIPGVLDELEQAVPRLADQIEPLANELTALDERQKALLRMFAVKRAEIKAQIAAVAQGATAGPDEVAEVYWRFEQVPVSALGTVHQVQRMAREHPWCSWRCGCGNEVFFGSRTEMHDFAAYWRCEQCQARGHAEREAASARQRERDHELATMPYRLYLQTPEWQERRKAALKRAGFRCQVCNRSRMLHVHHRTYERRGCELARDLIVLCDECHALYHRKGLIADAPGGDG